MYDKKSDEIHSYNHRWMILIRSIIKPSLCILYLANDRIYHLGKTQYLF